MKIKELKDRHNSEKEFHDQKYKNKKEKKNYYDLGITNPIFKIVLEKMGNLENKKVVDYGCGNGWMTKKLLDKGAQVFAFDISAEAVEMTKDLAKSLDKQDRVSVECMPAEKLNYDTDSLDAILGNAILHHLDLEIALNEIKRVLKKGGRAYFLEPLRLNPFINIFRRFTPHLRSEDELPLHIDDFKIFNEKFSDFEHKEYYLITLFAFFWHFVIRNDKLFVLSRNILMKIDNIFLTIFPFLRRYCWYTVLVMEK